LVFALLASFHYSFGTHVSRSDKILEQILRGTSDANIPFAGMRNLLSGLGFEERVRGSHHIFVRAGVEEILNLQPEGSKCKPYQVKQVRSAILKYKLAEGRNA
jgi:predicted RNA binding protein YcfA (HicA-like mRNA interferase family)